MHNTWKLMTVAIICAGLQAGCGGNEESPTPLPKPKAVALTMLKAMAAGDGDTAAACYDCSDEDKEYLMSTMPFLETSANLVDAATKAYGVDAWEVARDKAGIGMIIPDMTNAEKNMQCTITGDRAICTLQGLPYPLNLVRKDGLWLIVPQQGQLPLLHQRGDILKSILTAKAAIDAVILKIGAKNISVDDICAEVKKAMIPRR